MPHLLTDCHERFCFQTELTLKKTRQGPPAGLRTKRRLSQELSSQRRYHLFNNSIRFFRHLLIIRILNGCCTGLASRHSYQGRQPGFVLLLQTHLTLWIPPAFLGSQTIPCHANCTWYRSLSRETLDNKIIVFENLRPQCIGSRLRESRFSCSG